MEHIGNIVRLEKLFTDNTVGNFLGIPYEGNVCINLRTALEKLGFDPGSGRIFDERLKTAVLEFQRKYNHKNQDGFFGPGTRKLLAEVLMKQFENSIFSELTDFDVTNPLTLFISYAWLDNEKVNQIDQWLRDHGLKVRRDIYDFIPGRQLQEEIEKTIIESDKVLVVYSPNSKNRDWPKFELSIAEKIEKDKKMHFIIYLVLDDEPLPKYDTHRIAINAKGKTLKYIGEQIIKGVNGKLTDLPRYEYKEYEIFN